MACFAGMFLGVFLQVESCLAQGDENSSIGAADDCTDISIDFKDSPNLTRQEKTDLMNKALLNSLNKYERCQHLRSKAASSGASGGGAGSAGAGNAQQGSSTASSSMSGANTPGDKKPSANAQTGVKDDPVNKETHHRTKNGHTLGNGKIPDDIPPVDNDSILEEQIRQAAINETDPVIKEKLWNEYRKYKGLPVAKKGVTM